MIHTRAAALESRKKCNSSLHCQRSTAPLAVSAHLSSQLTIAPCQQLAARALGHPAVDARRPDRRPRRAAGRPALAELAARGGCPSCREAGGGQVRVREARRQVRAEARADGRPLRRARRVGRAQRAGNDAELRDESMRLRNDAASRCCAPRRRSGCARRPLRARDRDARHQLHRRKRRRGASTIGASTLVKSDTQAFPGSIRTRRRRGRRRRRSAVKLGGVRSVACWTLGDASGRLIEHCTAKRGAEKDARASTGRTSSSRPARR